MASGRHFELRTPEIISRYFHDSCLPISQDANAMER
jgi:hypothetical protein